MIRLFRPIDSWFRVEQVGNGITRIDEPHVHEFLRANIWHVRGQNRDLVIDTGLGVVSLQERVPDLFANHPILVITHAHLDHAGAAHEFADRRMHHLELTHAPIKASLRGPALATMLGGLNPAEMPQSFLDALPVEDYQLDDYAIPDAPTTALLDGDTVDLGDRQLQVVHLPGHTPGSIGLLEHATGAFFSGDALYDDVLLDGLDESNISDYVASMQRMRTLPAATVYPGHGPTFGARRLEHLTEAYLSSHVHLATNPDDPVNRLDH